MTRELQLHPGSTTRRARIPVAAAGAILAALLTIPASPRAAAPEEGKAPAPPAAPATMTLSATGEVEATPDLALVTAGIEADAPTAAAALAEAASRAQAVIAALGALGIEKRDIRTRRIDLTPIYEAPKRGQSEPPRIAGYRAGHSLALRLRAVERAGEVIDRLIAAGANRLGGITFTLADPGAAEDGARRRAVAKARRRAALYAEAAGVRLGRILSIAEAGGFRPVPVLRTRMAAMAEAAPTPVEPGELTVAATVTIVWEILPAE